MMTGTALVQPPEQEHQIDQVSLGGLTAGSIMAGGNDINTQPLAHNCCVLGKVGGCYVDVDLDSPSSNRPKCDHSPRRVCPPDSHLTKLLLTYGLLVTTIVVEKKRGRTNKGKFGGG